MDNRIFKIFCLLLSVGFLVAQTIFIYDNYKNNRKGLTQHDLLWTSVLQGLYVGMSTGIVIALLLDILQFYTNARITLTHVLTCIFFDIVCVITGLLAFYNKIDIIYIKNFTNVIFINFGGMALALIIALTLITVYRCRRRNSIYTV